MHAGKLGLTLAFAVFCSTAALAFDPVVVRDIQRADTPERLFDLAEDMMKKAAQTPAANAEEDLQKTVEMQTYLTYIDIKLKRLAFSEFEANLDKKLDLLIEGKKK